MPNIAKKDMLNVLGCHPTTSRIPYGIVNDALLVVLPLLVGSAFYIFYRPTNIIIFDLLSAIGVRPVLSSLRSFLQTELPIKNEDMLYSVPTGLWAFSLLSFVLIVWSGRTSIIKYLSIFTAVVVVEGSEIGQLAFLPGTFDMNDLACNSAGLALAWALSHLRDRHSIGLGYRKSTTGVGFSVFLLLAGASGESDSEKASRLKSEYNLSNSDYTADLKIFGSADNLEEALRLAKAKSLSLKQIDNGSREYGSLAIFKEALEFSETKGLALSQIANGVRDFGSLNDYKEAFEKKMTVAQFRGHKQQVSACKTDWRKCLDNEQLVNNYSDWTMVQVKCKSAANDRAKFGDPEWPWLPFGTFLTGNSYVTTGIAVAIEKDARFQNGFGAKARSEVTCTYDLRASKVVNVLVSPR
jgi:hypothetical protein